MAIHYAQAPAGKRDPFPPLVATFPAANEDGTGVLTVTVAYREIADALSVVGTDAIFRGSIAIDGNPVFAFDNIGFWITPERLPFSRDALKQAVRTTLAAGSTYPAISHGPNMNVISVSEYARIWKRAKQEITNELSLKSERRRASMAMGF